MHGRHDAARPLPAGCVMIPTRPNTPREAVAAPWSNPAEWQAVNQAFIRLIQRHDPFFASIRACALRLADHLNSLFLTADRLCRSTCRFCPDPCCEKAWAWFDFKDLLFMHLCGIEIPGSQALSAPGNRCRYLGHRGCRLPRNARPWVCTWYVCPTQAARMRRVPVALRGTFERTVGRVKRQRTALEEAFICITTGESWNGRSVGVSLAQEQGRLVEI